MNPWKDLTDTRPSKQEYATARKVSFLESPKKKRTPESIILVKVVVPSYDVLCTCGFRYGMHRVKDYACPNKKWKPGNGKSQWLRRWWERA